MADVRVRFAPSPTGPLHIGGARSALFNYLFAAHHQGALVIRIEDTDIERSQREYETEILESLTWLGLEWNEGIDTGGEFAPYRQMERRDLYQNFSRELLDQGGAYFCFCSQEDLEAERQSLMEDKGMPLYQGKCRELSIQETEQRLAEGFKPSIRFRVPANTVYVVDDLVRGRVSFDSDNIGDFIIMKSDGIPTYNFAVVVDDHLMKITHVIRAEEHLSNTPRQLMLFDALNFKRPQFAHISLILGSDRQKMSKRHGATSMIQYREMGYLPEAMFNFLALLGWSPEGEEEILSKEQLVQQFTLKRVARHPAVFDVDKLNWLNQQYIKQKTITELKALLKPFLLQSDLAPAVEALDDAKYELLVTAIRDYLVCLSDAPVHSRIFFTPRDEEPEAAAILQGEKVMQVLQYFSRELPETDGVDEIAGFLKSIAKKNKLKPKEVFMPLRCALTGQTKGPELPYLISIWGREETLRRMKQTMNLLL